MKLQSQTTLKLDRAELQRLAKASRPGLWERIDPLYVSLGSGFIVGALIVIVYRVVQ